MLLRGDSVVATWNLPNADRLDLSVVDDLARMQLAARRLGCCIRLHHPPGSLCDLIALSGLGRVLRSDLVVEMGGQPEGGKEVGVEEAVESGDPIT